MSNDILAIEAERAWAEEQQDTTATHWTPRDAFRIGYFRGLQDRDKVAAKLRSGVYGVMTPAEVIADRDAYNRAVEGDGEKFLAKFKEQP